MDPVVVPLSAPEATDAARFGPKAANLAALGRAGMPTPGGYAVDARAYRVQLAELHLEATARGGRRAFPHRGRRNADQRRGGLGLGGRAGRVGARALRARPVGCAQGVRARPHIPRGRLRARPARIFALALWRTMPRAGAGR